MQCTPECLDAMLTLKEEVDLWKGMYDSMKDRADRLTDLNMNLQEAQRSTPGLY